MSDWQAPNRAHPLPEADEPPLHRAARLGDHDAIRVLVASGEDVDARFDIARSPRAHREPTTALMIAAGSGEGATADTVQLLLDLGASIAPSPSGMSALSYACRGLGSRHRPGGDVARLAVLLRAGSDPDVAGPNGQSALALAAGTGDSERVRLLLEAGAHPAPDAERSFQVPLYQAVQADALASVQLLLEAGAPVNANVSFSIDPALSVAASLAVMSELLAAGADPFVELPHGRTIASDIARNGQGSVTERVSMLRRLAEAGLDLDRAGATGPTPLCDAAMGGNADAVEALLLVGANPHTERNALGTVCFGYSLDRDPGIERTIDLLVAAGLDPNDTDEDGNSPLHAALSADAYGPQYTESDGINVAAAFALLRHGASIDITYRDTGYRPLHAAAAGGSAQLIEVLLASGADPKERAGGGETALDVARAFGADDCVRVLEAATPSA